MPKLLTPSANMQTGNIPGLSGYQFSAVRADRLGASEYTLVTLVVDTSTSVSRFRDELVATLKTVVAGCRKSPRANNMLLRTVIFADDVSELHGFKPLSEINDTDFDVIRPYGNTALIDATASAIGAMAEYGRMLAKQDYAVNGCLYILTDGCDNRSTYGTATVKQKVDEILQDEVLESCLSVLVGINANQYRQLLEDFQRDAGITAYKDAGEATPGNMAKLAGFISRSVSSQASAQGTGTGTAAAPGPSQSIVI